MPRFLLAALIAVALALGGPLAPAAQAVTTVCPPSLGNTTINGHLVVPAGQTCRLDHVTVTGNVTVQASALFSLRSSTINGRLTATNAAGVGSLITPSRIKGSLEIGGTGVVVLQGLTVDGSVSLTNNQAVPMLNNLIGGSLTVTGNDIVSLGSNHVDGNLSCSGNGSIAGTGNTVGGKKFDQCAGF